MTDEELVAALGWEPFIPNANGEEYCELHGGWIKGPLCVNRLDDLSLVKQGMELVMPVLTDLIAELNVNPFTPAWITEATARAEARLKEVQGE